MTVDALASCVRQVINSHDIKLCMPGRPLASTGKDCVISEEWYEMQLRNYIFDKNIIDE